MTERKALALTLAAVTIVAAIVMTVLMAIHASGGVLSLAFLAILVVGADTCARVGMRYPDNRPPR